MQRYYSEMQNLYRGAKDENERVAILKAISNSGLSDFFPFLCELIKEQSTIPIRHDAIIAMRRMPKGITLKVNNCILLLLCKFSQLYEYMTYMEFLFFQVQNFLLPIFLDGLEAEEVRLAAYLVIMKSQPHYATVQSIMTSLYGEQSKRVGDFVYCHLLSVAESSRFSFRKT